MCPIVGGDLSSGHGVVARDHGGVAGVSRDRSRRAGAKVGDRRYVTGAERSGRRGDVPGRRGSSLVKWTARVSPTQYPRDRSRNRARRARRDIGDRYFPDGLAADRGAHRRGRARSASRSMPNGFPDLDGLSHWSRRRAPGRVRDCQSRRPSIDVRSIRWRNSGSSSPRSAGLLPVLQE